jgi:hypothetical protein
MVKVDPRGNKNINPNLDIAMTKELKIYLDQGKTNSEKIKYWRSFQIIVRKK